MEVYEYEVTRYDSNTGEGGLFADYVNTFLKLKVEARGYPSWVRTAENEDRYTSLFYKRAYDGTETLRYNAPKLCLAKLCLKSMWEN